MPYWYIDLSWIAEGMHLLPCRTFCECSVGPIDISVAKGFLGHCQHMILVEPNPVLASQAAFLLNRPVIKTAVGFKHGKASLIDNGGSSYLAGTWAPTPVKSGIAHSVDCVTFDEIDDGEIDILALDCEGMEWAVLSRMKSYPLLLTIEIWDGNPWKKEIMAWLDSHKYVLRFATGPTAETHLYTRSAYEFLDASGNVAA